jgi:hypothetical protein
MSPLILILSFMDPIKAALSDRQAGNMRAIGCPRFVINSPCGSSRSRMRKHFALNSLAEMVFSFVCTIPEHSSI